MERCRAVRQPLLVSVVPFGDARVEIPAVVVEAGRFRDAADLIECLLFEHAEADHDVSHLYACVVDVVLHLDGHPAEPQDPDERVPERGIAQVPDVCRLIGIDRRMFDDCLVLGQPRRVHVRRQPIEQKPAALEKEVQVPVRCRDNARHTLQRAERLGDFPRDHAGRLPQPTRQLERDGRAEVAELPAGRVLEDHRTCGRLVEPVELDQPAGHVCADTFLDG